MHDWSAFYLDHGFEGRWAIGTNTLMLFSNMLVHSSLDQELCCAYAAEDFAAKERFMQTDVRITAAAILARAARFDV